MNRQNFISPTYPATIALSEAHKPYLLAEMRDVCMRERKRFLSGGTVQHIYPSAKEFRRGNGCRLPYFGHLEGNDTLVVRTINGDVVVRGALASTWLSLDKFKVNRVKSTPRHGNTSTNASAAFRGAESQGISHE